MANLCLKSQNFWIKKNWLWTFGKRTKLIPFWVTNSHYVRRRRSTRWCCQSPDYHHHRCSTTRIPTTSTQPNPAVLAGPSSCSKDLVDYSVLGNANGCYSSFGNSNGILHRLLTSPKFASLLIYLFFNSTISSTQLGHSSKEWVGGWLLCKTVKISSMYLFDSNSPQRRPDDFSAFRELGHFGTSAQD